jgi:hypothetical protein
LEPVGNPGGICKGTVITNCSQDLPRIDGTAKRLNDNRVFLNTTNCIFKIHSCLYLLYSNMLARNAITLFRFPPTDMARKPKPPPLANSRALTEKERLEVLQRTAHRIHQLTGDTTDPTGTGKYLRYA